jgi:hypothetical protein
MTSILSTISGFFSKPLILSSFLPVTIFILLSWLLLVPILPPDYLVFQPLEGLEKEWKLLAVLFIAVVASGLIYNLNIQILRFYEGYPWEDSWIGRLRTKRYRNEYKRRETRIHGLRTLLLAMEAETKTAGKTKNLQLIEAAITKLRTNGVALRQIEAQDIQWEQMWFSPDDYQRRLVIVRWERLASLVLDEFTKMLEDIRVEFPQEELLIMPTRLGNTIRSFEHYPKREYGIDGAEMWPRLVASIDKDYATLVDDAKTSCDFFITCSMLSTFLAAAFIIVAFMRPVAVIGRGEFLFTIGKGLIFAFLSYALYRLAIPRALEWGKTVKSAFDLYRWKLLAQLGHKRDLTTRAAERQLWQEISRQTIFGDPFRKASIPDYINEMAPTAPFVSHGGTAGTLEIARGIKVLAESNRVTVVLSLRNTDAKHLADKIVITDKLPDGLHYEWGSAKTDQAGVDVSGANPYKFAVGQLAPNQSLTLTYNVISLSTNQTHDVGLHFSKA